MSDHFARELIKVAVVQICQDEGFQSIQSSALDALTDIMIKCTSFILFYFFSFCLFIFFILVVDLEEIGYGTHLYAEASCRTDCNFLDFSLALQDCNGSIRDLLDYSNQVDEIPFAKRL